MIDKNINELDKLRVNLCKQFINDCCIITKDINKKISSYGWKHKVEEYTKVNNKYDYVSNDNFIDACMELKLKSRDLPGLIYGNPKYTHNKYFNIKLRGRNNRQ